MRRLLVVGLLLSSCAGAAAADPATSAPATSARSTLPAPQLFRMDGPLATKIEDGARLPLANGWIEARLSGFPSSRAELDVLVVSGTTKTPAKADVTVFYEMADMDHGAEELQARLRADGHHTAQMELYMAGTWRIKIRVALDGVTSDVVLLVAPK